MNKGLGAVCLRVWIRESEKERESDRQRHRDCEEHEFVCRRERDRVCLCVRERGTYLNRCKCECLSERETEIERYEFACRLFMSRREKTCVFVSVCVRERVRDRVCVGKRELS